jgi:uncharacterized DUF497 family protein
MADVIYDNRFIWHDSKNASNKKKHHGLTFEKAVEVFKDPWLYEQPDEEHSITEDRYNATGIVDGWDYSRYVTVTITHRGSLTRIISAREADPEERRLYDAEYYTHVSVY